MTNLSSSTKRARVEQGVDALARGQLAGRMLLLDPIGAATCRSRPLLPSTAVARAEISGGVLLTRGTVDTRPPGCQTPACPAPARSSAIVGRPALGVRGLVERQGQRIRLSDPVGPPPPGGSRHRAAPRADVEPCARRHVARTARSWRAGIAFELFVEINLARSTACSGPATSSLIKTLGRHGADAHLTTIYRLFYRVGTVKWILARASRLWGLHYDSGTLHVDSQPGARGRAAHRGVQRARTGCIASRCWGWAERSVELSGGTRGPLRGDRLPHARRPALPLPAQLELSRVIVERRRAAQLDPSAGTERRRPSRPSVARRSSRIPVPSRLGCTRLVKRTTWRRWRGGSSHMRAAGEGEVAEAAVARPAGRRPAMTPGARARACPSRAASSSRASTAVVGEADARSARREVPGLSPATAAQHRAGEASDVRRRWRTGRRARRCRRPACAFSSCTSPATQAAPVRTDLGRRDLGGRAHRAELPGRRRTCCPSRAARAPAAPTARSSRSPADALERRPEQDVADVAVARHADRADLAEQRGARHPDDRLARARRAGADRRPTAARSTSRGLEIQPSGPRGGRL